MHVLRPLDSIEHAIRDDYPIPSKFISNRITYRGGLLAQSSDAFAGTLANVSSHIDGEQKLGPDGLPKGVYGVKCLPGYAWS